MLGLELPFQLADDLPICRRQIDSRANCIFSSHVKTVQHQKSSVKHKDGTGTKKA